MTTQEFLKKYNIGTTFEKMYEAQYKANKMKNFTFKDEYFVSDKNGDMLYATTYDRHRENIKRANE